MDMIQQIACLMLAASRSNLMFPSKITIKGLNLRENVRILEDLGG